MKLGTTFSMRPNLPGEMEKKILKGYRGLILDYRLLVLQEGEITSTSVSTLEKSDQGMWNITELQLPTL